MKRNNLFSRGKIITKQDLYCSEKLLGFPNDKSSPHKPLIQWDVLFQPCGWAGRYPLHPDTMALAGAFAFPGSALLRTMRVFKKRQPGAGDKAQRCPSESSQGCWDVKHSWISSTTTTRIPVLYSPGFLPDVYQLHPSSPPAISTCSVAKGDEIRSRCPPSELAHTFPTGWEHVLRVRKYSHSGITFAAILPPAYCLLLTIRLCCSSWRTST